MDDLTSAEFPDLHDSPVRQMCVISPLSKDDQVCDLIKVTEESLNVLELKPNAGSSDPDLGFPHCLGLYVTIKRWGVSFRSRHSLWSVFLHPCTSWVGVLHTTLPSKSHTCTF